MGVGYDDGTAGRKPVGPCRKEGEEGGGRFMQSVVVESSWCRDIDILEHSAVRDVAVHST